VKDIIACKYVCECYNISGDYDFRLKVMVRDMKHYQDFVLNDLGSIKNIGSAHSTFIMGVIKHDYAVPLLVVMPLQICNETQCMDALM
jgi:Lrp/AsnC family leucine-responsive transcriptional regulator